jgi:hypothetical protein
MCWNNLDHSNSLSTQIWTDNWSNGIACVAAASAHHHQRAGGNAAFHHTPDPRTCVSEWMENYSIMFYNLHHKQFVYRQPTAFLVTVCEHQQSSLDSRLAYFPVQILSDCVRAPSTLGSGRLINYRGCSISPKSTLSRSYDQSALIWFQTQASDFDRWSEQRHATFLFHYD